MAEQMLLRTLGVSRQAVPHAKLIVVTNSEAFCTSARLEGATALKDAGAGINEALELASNEIPEHDAMLVLPTDLALVSAMDIRHLVEQQGDCIIAPNRLRDGTNALLWRRQPRRFLFGPGSFTAHVQAAQSLGMDLKVVNLPGLAFDLDQPQELVELERLRPPARSVPRSGVAHNANATSQISAIK